MFPEDDEHANSHQLGSDPNTPVLVHWFWIQSCGFLPYELYYMALADIVLVQDMQCLLLLLCLPF